MSGGLYPSAGRIAKALILSAMLTDELSLWVLHDEDCLAGRVELRSRWVAYAALSALHLKAYPPVLGLMVGIADQARLEAWPVRLEPWWSDQTALTVLKAVVSVEDGPAEIEFRHLTRVLTDLVGERLDILQRGSRHAG